MFVAGESTSDDEEGRHSNPKSEAELEVEKEEGRGRAARLSVPVGRHVRRHGQTPGRHVASQVLLPPADGHHGLTPWLLVPAHPADHPPTRDPSAHIFTAHLLAPGKSLMHNSGCGV